MLTGHKTMPLQWFDFRHQGMFFIFFLSVYLSQPYINTGHTSPFISHVFVEIGMLWLFRILCRGAPTACNRLPMFNLIRNSVVHSLSFVTMTKGMGTYPPAPVAHSEISVRHAMPSLAITLVALTLTSRLYLQLTQSRRSTGSCSSAFEVANRIMSSA